MRKGSRQREKREWGRESLKGPTRVEDSTVFKRGKSDIPLLSIEIEESRRERECRRLVTEEEREERDCDCVVVIFVFGRLDWICGL
jgi:hypothetical protein